MDDVLQFLNPNKDTLNSASSQSIVKTLANSYFSLNALPTVQTLLAQSNDTDVTYDILDKLSSDERNDTKRVIKIIQTEFQKLFPEQRKRFARYAFFFF